MGTQLDSAPLVSNTGVKSLVWAGYPGQDGGTAIMNILTGKTAPAGRLPVTQYPVYPIVQAFKQVMLTRTVGRICRPSPNDQ
jgi:Glycosyl hydrolase family 3 C-terminal domain